MSFRLAQDSTNSSNWHRSLLGVSRESFYWTNRMLTFIVQYKLNYSTF